MLFLGRSVPDDMGVIRVEICVYATMRENDQRIFLVGIHTFRDEDISPELQFVSGAHPGRIRLFPAGGAAKVDFVDMAESPTFSYHRRSSTFFTTWSKIMLVVLLLWHSLLRI